MVGIVKSSTAYSAKTQSSEKEHNDCHVRALAIAANISYDASLAIHKKHGRKDRAATYGTTASRVVQEMGMRKLNIRRANEWGRAAYPTVKQFVWDHPKGRFLVHRSGHAFAIIDGVVHDWQSGTGPRSRIIWAAEV